MMLAIFNNRNFLTNKYIFLIFFLGIFIIHQFIFQQFFPNSKGLLGHDYEQFIPNFMFGKIWFYKNFLSIPWFTPSFCCGIPFYADPQTMYYSIPQIIFLIFNPIFSIKIIFFIFSLFGYLGMFLLVRKSFKFNSYVSLLCSSLFLFNGFFIYRAIAGHIAYLSYIFIPLYCFFLINSYEHQIKKQRFIFLILSSITFANFFHSGSGPIILIIFVSILSVLFLYSHLINNFKIFINLILSSLIGILISLSKITAVLFFLKNFPRNYPATEFHSFFSFIKIFFLSLFIKPNAEYFNNNVTSMFPFGIHEMEYTVGLAPVFLLFFVFFLNKNIFKLNYFNIRFFIITIIILFIPIFFNINFLNQFQLISKVPILNSTWIQFRWITIYILPIIIVSGLIIHNLNFNSLKKKYLSIFLISILLIQNFTKDKSWHFQDQKYNLKNAIEFSLNMKIGKQPEILGPAVLMDKFDSPKKTFNKNDMFFYGFSSFLCYQPIFGYGLEKLNTKKIIFNSKKIYSDNTYLLYSNKLDERGGYFTFFDPSCFIFSKENNCLPGDIFKISETEKLIKFTSYEKFNFKQNKIQVVANYLSIFSFVFCLLYLLYHFFIFIYSLRKKY